MMIGRTAKGNHPVTFAVAACETHNVNVTVLPSFGLSEGSSVTAKEMWSKMAQVKISPSFNYITVIYHLLFSNSCFGLVYQPCLPAGWTV